jgi:hypothetical protein
MEYAGLSSMPLLSGDETTNSAQTFDAQYDRPVDHLGDRADGGADAGTREAPPDEQAGGGPRPAPRLPADWLA